MALPAVLKMYSKARMDSFSNEVNTVARTARQQYLLDGGKNNIYSNADGSPKELSLTGNSNLKYYVEMDDSGNIIKLQVTNGDYQYNVSETGGINTASSDDVDVVSDLSSNEIIVIDSSLFREYVYTRAGGISVGSVIPSGKRTYDNYETLTTGTNSYPFFIRHTLENNIVVESHIGFVRNGNVYYIKGGDGGESYNDNKTIMQTAFGSSLCQYDTAARYYCRETNVVNAYAYNNGKVTGYLQGFECYVNGDGSSNCDWDN